MSQSVMELDKEWHELISQAAKLGLSKMEVKGFLNGSYELWKEERLTVLSKEDNKLSTN